MIRKQKRRRREGKSRIEALEKQVVLKLFLIVGPQNPGNLQGTISRKG
jgi:hypothetical protein